MVREWGTGRTRVEQMLALKLQPYPVAAHRLMDGIAAGRQTIPQARFDRVKCKAGLAALAHYRAEYDDERKVLKPVPLHDWACHGADAWRYLAMAWKALRPSQLPKPEPVFPGMPIGRVPTSGVNIQPVTMDRLWADHAKEARND